MSTFLSRLLGPSNESSHTASARLGLESLEAREVPAVNLINGELQIVQTNGIDTASVTQLGGVLLVNDNGWQSVHLAHRVSHIAYYGLGGNDTFSNGSWIRGYIYGGEGNDTLSGGSARDVIYGGGGNDYIDGGAGDDWLYGEGDGDTLIGNLGRDVLSGGDGDDYLSGGRFRDQDTLVGGAGRDTFEYDEYSTSKWWKPGSWWTRKSDTVVDFTYEDQWA